MTSPSHGMLRRRAALIGDLDEVRRDWHGIRTGTCRATALPVPVAVLLETDERGGAILTRYDVRGDFCGNTWHESERAAELEAIAEFGDALGAWQELPAGVTVGALFSCA